MTTVNGLPAHVLLVHAVVVLLPLAALLVLVSGVWPAAARRCAWPAAVLSLLVLVAVPLTTEAGEWLEHRVPRTDLVRTHTEAGDFVLPWAIALFVVALIILGRELLAARAAGAEGPGAATAPRPRPGGAVVTVIVAVLAVVVAATAVTVVVRVGDTGAKAAWTGRFSPTELPRPHLPGPPSGG